VVKFNNTIKLYFSDHIMNEVRKTVDETKYAGVIDQPKSMVFTGGRQEGGYCKSIIMVRTTTIMVRRKSQKEQVPMKLQLQQHQSLKQRW
jgi:hypothetical protein